MELSYGDTKVLLPGVLFNQCKGSISSGKKKDLLSKQNDRLCSISGTWASFLASVFSVIIRYLQSGNFPGCFIPRHRVSHGASFFGPWLFSTAEARTSNSESSFPAGGNGKRECVFCVRWIMFRALAASGKVFCGLFYRKTRGFSALKRGLRRNTRVLARPTRL